MTFIDDGLGALTALRGVASLNLQGCATLTDKGLEAIAHMTSLTSVNLQDCRQISGARSHSVVDLFRVHKQWQILPNVTHVERPLATPVFGVSLCESNMGGGRCTLPRMHSVAFYSCECLGSLQEPVLRSICRFCRQDDC